MRRAPIFGTYQVFALKCIVEIVRENSPLSNILQSELSLVTGPASINNRH